MPFIGIIEFLNANAGAFGFLATLALVVATVIYVFFSRKLVVETIRIRRVSTEPCVSVHVEPEKDAFPALNIVIQNIGNGEAFDVSFEFIPENPFKQFANHRGPLLSDVRIFKGLSYLAPGQRICTFLGLATDFLKSKDIEPFEIAATYHDKGGKEFTSRFRIDLNELRGLQRKRGESPIIKIHRVLERLERTLGQIRDKME